MSVLCRCAGSKLTRGCGVAEDWTDSIDIAAVLLVE